MTCVSVHSFRHNAARTFACGRIVRLCNTCHAEFQGYLQHVTDHGGPSQIRMRSVTNSAHAHLNIPANMEGSKFVRKIRSTARSCNGRLAYFSHLRILIPPPTPGREKTDEHPEEPASLVGKDGSRQSRAANSSTGAQVYLQSDSTDASGESAGTLNGSAQHGQFLGFRRVSATSPMHPESPMKVQHKCSLDKSAGELHNDLILVFKQMVDEGFVVLVPPTRELEERLYENDDVQVISDDTALEETNLKWSAAQWAELGFGAERTASGWESVFQAEKAALPRHISNHTGRKVVLPVTPRHTRRGYRKFRRSAHLRILVPPPTPGREKTDEHPEEPASLVGKDGSRQSRAANSSTGAQVYLQSDSTDASGESAGTLNGSAQHGQFLGFRRVSATSPMHPESPMKVQHKCSLDKSAGELHNDLILVFKQMVDEGFVVLVPPTRELEEMFTSDDEKCGQGKG